jgi:hypothetical protein
LSAEQLSERGVACGMRAAEFSLSVCCQSESLVAGLTGIESVSKCGRDEDHIEDCEQLVEVDVPVGGLSCLRCDH